MARRAAASSRWKGCGSQAAAKRLIRSAVNVCCRHGTSPTAIVLEEPHGGRPAARSRIGFSIHITVSPGWLVTSWRKRDEAEVGLGSWRRASPSTVERPESVSPGLTGRSHFSVSTPGEPIEAASISQPSAEHPHEERAGVPAGSDQPAEQRVLPAPSSRWKGCGSNSRAKATISARVTVCGSRGSSSPGEKVLEIAHGDPEMMARN